MKIVNVKDLKGTERQVNCPHGGFLSHRIILKSDNMGFSLTYTEIPAGDWEYWHYKNHLESCYCIKGKGVVHDVKNNKYHDIKPGMTYILDKNDAHRFKAIKDVILLCVFNPPLNGTEVHQDDGSYSV